jgi:prepilin-type N-terminal cleavage/methylation domain-containing protein
MLMSADRMARRQRRTGLAAGGSEGFTLVELLVALMVFVVGVLAVTGSSTVVMSMVGGSHRRTIAAAVAESRFERLRSTSCATHTNGTTTTRGVRETWTIVPGAFTNDVTVLVTYASSGGRVSTQTYQSFIPC